MFGSGRYVLFPDTPRELIVPNTIVKDGSEKFMKKIFQDLDNLPASFWVGLTNASYTFLSASLVDIAAGEPTGNGYTRQEVVRDDTDWDVSFVNNLWRSRSKQLTFTASDAWDKTWDRMFITDQETGTGGIVFSLSAQTPTPQTVLSGGGPVVRYEMWSRY